MSLHLSFYNQGLQKRALWEAKEEAQNLAANGANGWPKLPVPSSLPITVLQPA